MSDDDAELPDFDITFEDAPRSPACLIVLILVTPVLLICSLAFLAGLVLLSYQIVSTWQH